LRSLNFCGWAAFALLASASQTDAATWTKLTNPSPDFPGVMMQLTDGTIMVQGSGASWMKLTPDSTGSYINGTWSTLASMNLARLYFASNVLPTGKVWVMGGEYTGPNFDQNFGPNAEIYDPVANTWSPAAQYPSQANCPSPINVTALAARTVGSNILTNIPTTGRMVVGWTVTGTGIPAGTTITSVDSSTQVHISNNATATGNTTLTFRGNPVACFGDVPSTLLNGGKILAGNLIDRTAFIYDTVANTWTGTGSKVYDQSDEESWAKLPNGKILTYDIFTSVGTSGAYAEVYDPVAGSWSSISPSDGSALGTIPQLSSSAVGYELGPILRLQDGRIFVIGATQHTALYNPTTNTWSAGPDTIGTLNGISAPFGADDAPAAILPNGHVIYAADAGPAVLTTNGNITSGSNIITGISSTATFQVGWGVSGSGIPASTTISSVDSPTQIHISKNATSTATVSLTFGGVFSRPTEIFDFNPNTNTTSQLSPAIPDTNLPTTSSYVTRMLTLPNGQVLFSDSSRQLWSFTPDGTAPFASKPVINNIVYNGLGVFTLTGKQLNGQSAGASYGDDVQSDSNFPIVRLVNSTGKVYYCRTTNWSSTGVGTGSLLETVNFTLNPAVTAGNYSLIVSGAGISSFPSAINITQAEVNGQ
jgi:hypothetical protein